MARILLAANYIEATTPFNPLVPIHLWNSGHLQLVFDGQDGSPLVEVEVQSPTFVTIGDWQYPDFGQRHGENTSYISDDDIVEDADRYASVELQLREGQTVERVWELLGQIHESFQDNGTDINYDAYLNSNSYATSLLGIIGVPLTEALLDSVTPDDVWRFPGAFADVLEDGALETALSNERTPIRLEVTGTAGDDYIRSGTGDDNLGGAAGEDTIIGGAGDDQIHGGIGDDTLDAGDDNDDLHGGLGDDELLGGAGADVIFDNGAATSIQENESADDFIDRSNTYDGSGNDTVDGGGGSDLLVYSGGQDSFSGGTGNDTYAMASGLDGTRNGGDRLTIQLAEDRNDPSSYFGNDKLVGDPASVERVDFQGVTLDDISVNFQYEKFDLGFVEFDELDTWFINLIGIPSLPLGGAEVIAVVGSVEIIVDSTGSSFLIENVTGMRFEGQGAIRSVAAVNLPFFFTFDDPDNPGARVFSELRTKLLTTDGENFLPSQELSETAGVATESHILERINEDNPEDNENLEDLTGTSGNDDLDGSEGSDRIEGLEGADDLSGGNGNDVIEGGAGADAMAGGTGADFITYSSSASGVTINFSSATEGTGSNGDAEGDTFTEIEGVVGSEFDDTFWLSGDGDGTQVFGLGGDDYIRGAGDNEFLSGGEGNDTIIAGFNGGTMLGGDGDDLLAGRRGVNIIFGGAGDDIIDPGLNAENTVDQVYGGTGTDTIRFQNMPSVFFPSPVRVDLAEGLASSPDVLGTVTIDGIENVIGGTRSDEIAGDAAANVLQGLSGDDIILGRNGDDTLDGGNNDDELDGGGGNDLLIGGDGEDVIRGGEGVDTAQFADNFSDYTFSYVNGAMTVTDGSGDVDRVYADVEFLEFADQTRTFDEIYQTLSNVLVAIDDTATVAEAGVVDIDVLANDRTTDGSTPTITAIVGQSVSVGDVLTIDPGVTVELLANGMLRFGVNDAYDGLDDGETYTGTISYTITDVSGEIDNGSVAITIEGETVFVNGTAAGETINGSDRGETINAGAGDDLVFGGGGDDDLFGGDGDDMLLGEAGRDHFDGGAGNDTANFSYTNTGLRIDLLQGGVALSGNNPFLESLTSIENVIGSHGHDTIDGDDDANILSGLTGNDTIDAAGGDDTIIGGNNNDNLSGGAGADLFRFATGDDDDVVADFDVANDTIEIDGLIIDPHNLPAGVTAVDQGSDLLVSYGSGDTILLQGTSLAAWQAANVPSIPGVVEGTELADTIDINYVDSDGDSVLDDSLNPDTVYGYGGNDTINLGSGSDTAYGGEGDDVIRGVKNNNTLYGEAGNDTLNTGRHSSTLDGGAGDDLLEAVLSNGGDHTLTGGSGADVFEFIGNRSDKTSTLSITDYEVGIDRVVIDDLDIGTLDPSNLPSGLSVTESNGDLIIHFDGSDTITIDNVTSADFFGSAPPPPPVPSVDGTSGDDVMNLSFVDGDGESIVDDSGVEDLVYGNDGNDIITLYAGDDEAHGGNGNDTIYGSKGNNLIYGEAGNDTLNTGKHGSTLDGGLGDDLLEAVLINGGDHTLTGGSGSDVFSFISNRSDKTSTMTVTDFETGIDRIEIDGLDIGTLDPNNLPAGISVSDSNGDLTIHFDGTDTITATSVTSADFFGSASPPPPVPSVDGTSGDDVMNLSYVDADGDAITDDSGVEDLVYGFDGDDTITLYAGNDEAYGGNGNDTIYGVKNNNLIFGEAGNDTLYTGKHSSTLGGGVGDDLLLAQLHNGGDHTLTGGSGADTFEFSSNRSDKNSDVTITDFEVGIDILLINGVDTSTLDPNALPSGYDKSTDANGSLVIHFDSMSDTVVLNGVTESEFWSV